VCCNPHSLTYPGWSRLCEALGSDFAPFLPHVLPPLLRAAAFQPASSPLAGDAEVDSAIAMTQTAEMDEKVLAFESLAKFAQVMEGAMVPWLDQMMDLTLEALTFPHSDTVREKAAFLVPALLRVVKADDKTWMKRNPLSHVIYTLINAMVKELDWANLALLYKSFIDSVRVVNCPLPQALRSHFLRTVSNHLRDVRDFRSDRQAQVPYWGAVARAEAKEAEGIEDEVLGLMNGGLAMILIFVKDDPAGKRTVKELQDSVLEVKKMDVNWELYP